jgi:competence protein ComEA
MKGFIRAAFFLLLSIATVAQAQPERVNINRAGAEELVKLKGIGAKFAERIVQYREEHGPFESVEALQGVRGIGAKIVEMNRERLVVADPGAE